ncbi:hypothetical protein [Lentibacillus cibarius]|uniref:DUF927 domain-containing protein n=1 Tax=Lentibacillus cibarius TaxID=2583219 RepID=A0A5S3QMX6_9BACI|nr:hypothetical protein [Lentibacillus cibarius]TMN21836.1 hypothetical protein FFL34_06705 [Lentibacillus cibarius]
MSNLENYLNDLPFELTEEEKKEWREEGINNKTANQQDDIPNPFLDEDTNANIVSIEERRKNRKKTELRDFTLYEDVMKAIQEDENKQSTSSDTDASEKDNKIVSDLKNYVLPFDDISTKINFKKMYYYIYYKAGKEFKEERLSNFLILPLYAIKAEDGSQKMYARLINQETSVEVIFDGEKLSNQRSFKTFVKSYGNYNWNGKQHNLNDLNDLLSAYKLDEIEEKTYAGWHKREKMWLFPDRAYHNGNVYPVNDDKVTINGKSFTFDREVKNEVKIIREHIDLPEDTNEINNVVESFIKLYKKDGHLGIGWIIASFVADDISSKKLAGQFPLLAPYGIYQSGKTGYVRFLSEMAGIDTELNTEPSKDVWRKDLHNFSCLPIIYDEVKEKKGPNGYIKEMRPYINKTFDRATFKKGSIDKYATEHYEVHGTLGLLGEVPPTDSAILSRFIYIDSSKMSKNKSLYHIVKSNQHILNAIGQYFMRTSEDWKPDFMASYQEFLVDLGERDIKDDRMEISYAIILAGAKTFLKVLEKLVGEGKFNSERTIKELVDYVESKIKSNGQDLRQSHPSMQFLEDIGTMVGEKEIIDTAFTIRINHEFEGKLYKKILFLAPSSIWKAHKKNQVSDPFYTSSGQLKNDLKTYSFFIGSKSFRVSPKLKSAPTCWMIDLTDPSLPTEMQNFDYCK